MVYRHKLLNDKWVIEDIYHGLRGGFFLEAGAIDGIRASASWALEKHYGWDGICVEPIDAHYEKLVTNRSCKADNRALYSETGQRLDFLQLHAFPGRSGLVDHLRRDTIARANDTGATKDTKETVSLFDLLRQHEAPNTIEYMCLDVEGAEQPILAHFPFDKPFRILAISIEGNACTPLLLQNGYEEVKNPHTQAAHEHYYLHRDLRAMLGTMG